MHTIPASNTQTTTYHHTTFNPTTLPQSLAPTSAELSYVHTQASCPTTHPAGAGSASLGLVAHLVQGAEGPGNVAAVQLTQELVDVLGAAAGQPQHTM